MKEFISCDLEEGQRGSAVQGAVFDDVLFGQVLDGLDRRLHAFDGEEGGQVGSVGRDQYQSEEPPDAAHQSRRHGARSYLGP